MQSLVVTTAFMQRQRDEVIEITKKEDDFMVLMRASQGIPSEQIDILSNCLRNTRTNGQMGRYRLIINEAMVLQPSFYVEGVDPHVSWANKQFACANCHHQTSFDDVIKTFQLLLPHNTYSCMCLNCF